MVLRLYTADSRIGDDHRIGGGAFADSVDAALLEAIAPAVDGQVSLHLPGSATEIATESLRSLATSEFNRWLRPDVTPDENVDRLSSLLDACLRVLRLSDKYTTAVVQSLGSEESLIEVKEVWWGKWLVMRKKKNTPEWLRDYFGRTHYAEIFDGAGPELVQVWVSRVQKLERAIAAGRDAGHDVSLLLGELEFRQRSLLYSLSPPVKHKGGKH